MATVPDLDRPWEWGDPRRDRALIPYVDEECAVILDEAVTSLALVRAPMWLGDAGPTVSVLVSLAEAIAGRLWDAVAEARDQGYTWDEIASRLAASPAGARRRYGPYARSKRSEACGLVGRRGR